jgi:hypothetical protein
LFRLKIKMPANNIEPTISTWANPGPNSFNTASIHEPGGHLRFIGGYIPTLTPNLEAAEKAEHAAKHHLAQREESFARSDTDGFLSQWASDITSNMHSLEAQVAKKGGYDLFPGLFDIETGKRIRAKLIPTKYGEAWAMLDENHKFTGEFVSDSRGPRAALRKRGWVVLAEYAPAKATILGHGTGLSGHAWAAIVRTDGGCPR